jgi:hypothetical protein
MRNEAGIASESEGLVLLLSVYLSGTKKNLVRY